VADGPWYVQLMRERVDVSPVRDQIVFGRTFAEALAALPQADAEVARMSEAICGTAPAFRGAPTGGEADGHV
jgi:nitrite reductase (NADH) large subunit